MTKNEIIEELESCYKTMSTYIGNSEECRRHNEAILQAINAVKEIEQYHAIGTVDECQKSANVRKQVTEIVDRQLIAGKNNFKETYDCFHEIANVVQDNY